jgi:hypothetical protein
MVKYFPDLQSLGPWLAATVYICVIGLLMWGRYLWGPWQRMQLLRPD